MLEKARKLIRQNQITGALELLDSIYNEWNEEEKKSYDLYSMQLNNWEHCSRMGLDPLKSDKNKAIYGLLSLLSELEKAKQENEQINNQYEYEKEIASIYTKQSELINNRKPIDRAIGDLKNQYKDIYDVVEKLSKSIVKIEKIIKNRKLPPTQAEKLEESKSVIYKKVQSLSSIIKNTELKEDSIHEIDTGLFKDLTYLKKWRTQEIHRQACMNLLEKRVRNLERRYKIGLLLGSFGIFLLSIKHISTESIYGHGYDEEGYDEHGFDDSGYNREGFDKESMDIFGENDIHEDGVDTMELELEH